MFGWLNKKKYKKVEYLRIAAHTEIPVELKCRMQFDGSFMRPLFGRSVYLEVATAKTSRWTYVLVSRRNSSILVEKFRYHVVSHSLVWEGKAVGREGAMIRREVSS